MKDFIRQFFATVKDLITHPKKLIPTFVLCGIWLVFSLMSAFGANMPVLRFLYTLTYANGGMYGGFFGALGGIFGKAVFAAFVNSAVLAITEKQPLFNKSGLRVILKTSAASGLSSVAPFVTAGGAGLLLYWFFNVTASKTNVAVAIAAALAAIASASRQKGLLFSLVAGIINKFAKKKVINKMVISRVLTGMSMGFALGFILTFTRSALAIVIVAVVLLVAGIVAGIVGSKGSKAVAAALIVMMVVPTFLAGSCLDRVQAASFCAPSECPGLSDTVKPGQKGAVGASSAVTQFIDAARLGFGRASSEMLDGHIDREMYGCPLSSANIGSNNLTTTDVVRGGGRSSLTVEGLTGCYTNGQKGDLLDYSEYMYNVSYTFSVEFTDLEYFEGKVTGNAKGEEVLSWGLTNPDKTYNNGVVENKLDGKKLEGVWYVDNSQLFLMFQVPGNSGTLTLYLEVSQVLPKEGDEEYVKWRGRLTYSNGETNKYGQPFPDLMDFDGDGDMDFADEAVRRQLSHNPDYLDLPGSPAAKVLTALLIALLGGVGGAAAGVVSGAMGGAAGALSSAAEEAVLEAAGDAVSRSGVTASGPDLGQYITRDSDGDLNVTDPATGEARLYKANGDGTYTNPLTGATYTEAELVSSIDSRAENAALFAQDARTAKDAIASQRADNQGLSDYAHQYSEEKHAAEAALNKELYEDRLAIKYGTDKDGLKDAIASKQAQNQASAEYYQNRAENMDNVVKGLEVTQAAADIGVDVLANMTGGAGQTIKKIYTVGKNTASRLSEAAVSTDPNKKDFGAALAMAGFDSLADIGQDMAGNAGFHITSNIGSEVFKNGMQNLYDGKDFFEGAGQKVVTGTAKGLVDKFGAVLNGNQSKITQETLHKDMAMIGHLSANGKISDKGLRALRDMRLMTYVNNVHAEQALSNITTVAGDVSKIVIDGTSDAYSAISDAMKKD